MKTRNEPRRRAGGFTLIELLVVISIIVVLAAMTLTAISMVTKRSRTLQTQAHATGLLQAIQAFHTNYNRLPDAGAPGDELRVEGQSGSELLIILLGKEEVGSPMQNKNQIVFLHVGETTVKTKGGLLYSSGGKGATPVGLYDAWGNALYVKFDTAGKGEIEDPLKPGNVVRDHSVIVYSYGADGKPGTSDDIKTW